MGLKYTIEPDFTKMGYTTEFFVRVKFKEGVIADEDKIKMILDSCPYVSFAALTKGDFDLFIWSIAPSREEYEDGMEAKVRSSLDEYIQDWTAHGILVKRGGFIPVSNELIEMLDVKDKNKKILKILNENSRISLTELARKLNVSKPTAFYYINRTSTFIKHFTSFFGSPEEFIYSIRFFQICGCEADFKNYGPAIYNLYLSEHEKFFNKIVYAVVPDGGMDNFFLEAFGSMKEYTNHEKILSKYKDKVIRKQVSAIITNVLKGKLPIRKTDLSKEIPYILTPKEVH
ncbi:winged helix-turn-helix domain-containing protein [archaeon]|nr:winged helix-turn-helix domain-containing protein [archaeon]